MPTEADRERASATTTRSDPGRGLQSRARRYALLTASIAAGLAFGLFFGSRTGVKPALQAGATIDGPAAVAPPSSSQEVARLLEEVRSLRAQVESMRHAGETMRIPERLRALEAGRELDRDASRGLERTIAAMAVRIDKVETKVAKLQALLELTEKVKIDQTPVGSAPQGQKARRPRTVDIGYRLRSAYDDRAPTDRDRAQEKRAQERW